MAEAKILLQAHAQGMWEEVYKLYQRKALCDYIIVSRDNVQFPVHKLAVAAVNPKFCAALFPEGDNKLSPEIPGCIFVTDEVLLMTGELGHEHVNSLFNFVFSYMRVYMVYESSFSLTNHVNCLFYFNCLCASDKLQSLDCLTHHKLVS